MTIDANQRKAMAAGMRLTATYKKQEHTAELIEGEEGELLYRLADGREFKSPSAAGSAVMGSKACNGWRFWSLAGEGPEPEPTVEPETTHEPEPDGQPSASRKPFCGACGKSFISAKQWEHHQANAERLCKPTAA